MTKARFSEVHDDDEHDNTHTRASIRVHAENHMWTPSDDGEVPENDDDEEHDGTHTTAYICTQTTTHRHLVTTARFSGMTMMRSMMT